MRDTFGRTIDYLRLSVTEACNLHCLYCRPEGFVPRAASTLGVKEIERIVRAAVAVGITRVRLTGGEPLLRRDIVEIVRAIASIEGVRDLSMTTNGFRLAQLAEPLAQAGLRRVNVSLDSLIRERFARIVGVDAFDAVWTGMRAAEAAGLQPLKINVVALRGLNDDEIPDFARLTIDHAWHVRFIELMPVGVNGAARDLFTRHFISADDLRERLPAIEPFSAPAGSGPARTYRLPGAVGTIGFITPASKHFCATCNRVRITAQGTLRPCLFGEGEFVLPPDASDSALQESLRRAIDAKPEHHPLGEGFHIVARSMSEIGG